MGLRLVRGVRDVGELASVWGNRNHFTDAAGGRLGRRKEDGRTDAERLGGFTQKGPRDGCRAGGGKREGSVEERTAARGGGSGRRRLWLDNLDSGEEAVAAAGDRFDVAGTLGIVEESLAKTAHGGVDAALEVDIDTVGPE